MSSITENQRATNRTRAQDAARRLVEALRELTKAEANEVLHALVDQLEREERSRP